MGNATWLSDLADDVRFGFRTLRKTPGFTAIAIITLALGIGANTAIFSAIETVLLRPLPYPDPASLVEMRNTYPAFEPVGFSPGDYMDFHREAKSFSAMGAYTQPPQEFNLTGSGEPVRIESATASFDLFPMLGIRAAVGRTFQQEEDQAHGPAVALLGHAFWLRRFGADPSAVGRDVLLDGQKYRIVGVLPETFEIGGDIDVWRPLSHDGDMDNHIYHGTVAVARLKPNVTVARAQSEMDMLHRQEGITYSDSHSGWGTMVRVLENPAAAKMRTTLLVLFGAVGLVLLIACTNIANLLLTRNAARAREMALRTALGAAPGRLVRQLLAESVLLSLCGGAAGLLLAVGGIRALTVLAPPEISAIRDAAIDSQVLIFTVVLCLVTGIVSGLLPALRARLLDLNGILKQGSKGAGAPGSHRVHNTLVVAEIALALIPLVGAGLLLQSFWRLLDVSPGFQTEHILTMQLRQASLPPKVADNLSDAEQLDLFKKQAIQFDQIVQRVGALPGVKSAAGISVLPLAAEIHEATRFVIDGQPLVGVGVRPIAQHRSVTPGYFATVGIPLIKGRDLTRDDWTKDKVVINEAIVRRFFANEDPIGHRLNFCSLDPKPCWFSIVGVAGDVHQFGLEESPTYDAYVSGGWPGHLLIRTVSDPTTIAASATRIVHEVDPDVPINEVTTLDGLLSRSLSPRRFAMVLIGVLAALALVLSAVGIYGVMSYTVGQRTQEIGVRMALGAQPKNMLALVLGRGAALALAGIFAGTLGALALTRFLSSLLYGVAPKDPLTFAAVALLLFAVALAACYFPARRAMRVDPMVALRYE